MNSAWTIEVSIAAERQLSKLDRSVAKRVTRFLLERIAGADDPRSIGKPLQGNMDAFWCYRVGDYRVICEIHDHRVVVVVIDVEHRRKIYR